MVELTAVAVLVTVGAVSGSFRDLMEAYYREGEKFPYSSWWRAVGTRVIWVALGVAWTVVVLK